MKKLAFVLAITMAAPAVANDYWDEYDYDYDSDAATEMNIRRDTYVGFRLHKNESLAFEYDVHGGNDTNVSKDNWGFGVVVGNRLSDHVKIEYETMYTGISQTKYATSYDFDIWANMLNTYLFYEFDKAIAPYAGLGIGFSSIWGAVSVPGTSDYAFDLSYSAMLGVNFALNDRVDLNLGVKYQYYGRVAHKFNDEEFAVTDIDSTEFYFGAVYKFGL